MAGFSFGMIVDIQAGMGAIAFTIVIVFLIIFDKILNFLQILEEDYNAVYHMIQTVYKELMIMGFISFCVVMLNTNSSLGYKSDEWMAAIEFAHIVLFFQAIFYLVHAAFLIMLLVFLSKGYRESHAINENKILNDMKKKKSFIEDIMYHNSYLPQSRLRQNVEFKIHYHLFRDAFELPVAFDFALYLTLCTEKYILHLLEISLVERIVLIIIVLLNFAFRVLVESSVEHGSSCTNNKSELYNEHRSAGDSCKMEMLYIFIALGFILAIWSLILLVITRLYEIRLIKYTGADEVNKFQYYLENKANIACNKSKRHGGSPPAPARRKSYVSLRNNMRKMTMSVQELKRNIENIQAEMKEEQDSTRRAIFSFFSTVEEWFAMFCLRSPKLWKRRTMDGNTMNMLKDADVSKKKLKRDNQIGSSGPFSPPSIGDYEQKMELPALNNNNIQSTNTNNSTSNADDEEELNLNNFSIKAKAQSNKFSVIYFLKNKTIYLRAVEITIMFNCLWLAFWATSFISIANESGIPVLWQSAMVVPIVVIMPILGFIVKTSARLVAITNFDMDVFGKVLEISEEVELLVQELREHLSAKMSLLVGAKRTKLKREVIQSLFNEIDLGGNGKLSKVEFRRFLRLLDLYYSNSKYNNLFHAIDSDKDGFISDAEFNILLYEDEQMLAQQFLLKQQSSSMSPPDMLSNDDNKNSSKGSNFTSGSHKNGVASPGGRGLRQLSSGKPLPPVRGNLKKAQSVGLIGRRESFMEESADNNNNNNNNNNNYNNNLKDMVVAENGIAGNKANMRRMDYSSPSISDLSGLDQSQHRDNRSRRRKKSNVRTVDDVVSIRATDSSFFISAASSSKSNSKVIPTSFLDEEDNMTTTTARGGTGTGTASGPGVNIELNNTSHSSPTINRLRDEHNGSRNSSGRFLAQKSSPETSLFDGLRGRFSDNAEELSSLRLIPLTSSITDNNFMTVEIEDDVVMKEGVDAAAVEDSKTREEAENFPS